MFCPDINEECIRELCRDWREKEGKCRVTLQYEQNIKTTQDQLKLMEGYAKLVDIERFNFLIGKVSINQMLADPTLDPVIKNTIKQAFEAESSEVAEKLLRDAGLIQ